MELNEGAQIDTGQIEDRRGSAGGGLGGMLPIGGGRGGIVGLVITVILALAGGGYGASQLIGGDGGGGGDNTSLGQECASTNPDRLQDVDCRNTLYVNSIQNFWQAELPQAFDRSYQPAKTVFFQQQAQTGCGTADTGVGPFYCPQDKLVYIDLGFYQELTDQFGAKGAFAQPYVLAHEYGHHVQDLVGTLPRVDKIMQSDPDSAGRYSVMLELQADCYAGVWAAHATQTRDARQQPIFKQVTQQDIQDAVNTAGAVGDDAIQKKMGGGVDESKFTHGSSEQRQQWFTRGFSGGDMAQCDTFGNAL
jgi:predicted metalloprotease